MGYGARLGGGSWIAIGGLVCRRAKRRSSGLLALPLAIFLAEWRRARQPTAAGVLGWVTFAVREASLTMIALWRLWAWSNTVT